MPDQRSPATTIARIVVFAAFMAALGIAPGLNIGPSGVPITLQNMGPLLAATIIGARQATAATALWLALAALGLPLLVNGRGGLGPFVGLSSGFLYGYLLSALVTGLLAGVALRRTGAPRVVGLLLAGLLGVAADYLIAIPVWGSFIGSLGSAALQSLVYLPGDLAKVVLVTVVATIVHRALPGTFPRAPRRDRTGAPSPARRSAA